MRITICEDMDFYLAPIQQAIQHWMSVSGHTDVIVTVFKSSEDLLQRIETKFEEDLLFLYIQIKGEMNGIELAHKIRQLGLDTVIVFCTNFPQYVYEGYTVNALRFLPKPVSESDISYCCNYVYNRLSIENKNTLAIISAGKRYVLHYYEILYVEARSHCIYISTTITSAPLKINANLSDIVSSLPQELFIPCHRSYIVNVAHIRLVTRTECLLSGNISIPISRTYTLSVNQAFDRYHQGGIYNYGVDNI